MAVGDGQREGAAATRIGWQEWFPVVGGRESILP
jgi:hypothetical protein